MLIGSGRTFSFPPSNSNNFCLNIILWFWLLISRRKCGILLNMVGHAFTRKNMQKKISMECGFVETAICLMLAVPRCTKKSVITSLQKRMSWDTNVQCVIFEWANKRQRFEIYEVHFYMVEWKQLAVGPEERDGGREREKTSKRVRRKHKISFEKNMFIRWIEMNRRS